MYMVYMVYIVYIVYESKWELLEVASYTLEHETFVPESITPVAPGRMLVATLVSELATLSG
jgi:hypothetical protein